MRNRRLITTVLVVVIWIVVIFMFVSRASAVTKPGPTFHSCGDTFQTSSNIPGMSIQSIQVNCSPPPTYPLGHEKRCKLHYEKTILSRVDRQGPIRYALCVMKPNSTTTTIEPS